MIALLFAGVFTWTVIDVIFYFSMENFAKTFRRDFSGYIYLALAIFMSVTPIDVLLSTQRERVPE